MEILPVDIRGIRRNNLTRLIAEAGGQKALAARSGVSAAYLSQVLSARIRRNVGHNLARRLERGMAKPYGWMDVMDPTDGDVQARQAERPAIGYGVQSPRRQGLMALVDTAGGVAELSRATGVWMPYLAQVVRAERCRAVPYGLARHLERQTGHHRGWLDHPDRADQPG